MRIIAGKYRHRLIDYPENIPTIRPTKDRIRESIFSALGDINGTIVLDLFAGSGAMGIEAISRGSKEAYFVDHDDLAIKVISHNITSLGIDNGKIYKADAFIKIEDFAKNNQQFDIIFLDPPYAINQYLNLINKIIRENILEENGVIVVESSSEISYDDFAFKKIKRYHYGKSNVDILWS